MLPSLLLAAAAATLDYSEVVCPYWGAAIVNLIPLHRSWVGIVMGGGCCEFTSLMDLFRKINDILEAADAEEAERRSPTGAASSDDNRVLQLPTTYTISGSQDFNRGRSVHPRASGEVRSDSGMSWAAAAAGGSSWVKGLSNRASAALQNIATPPRGPPTSTEHVSLGAYRRSSPEPSRVVPDDLFGGGAAGDANDDLLVWESEAATSTWKPRGQQLAGGPFPSPPTAITPSDVFSDATAKAGRAISEEEEGSDEGSAGVKEEPLPPPQAPSGEALPLPGAPTKEALPSPQTPTEEALPSPQTPTEEALPSPQTPTEEALPSPQTPTEGALPSPQTPTEEALPSPQTPTERPLPPSQAPTGKLSSSREAPIEEPLLSLEVATGEPLLSPEVATREPLPSLQVPIEETPPPPQALTDQPPPPPQDLTGEPLPSPETATEKPLPPPQVPIGELLSSPEAPTEEPLPPPQAPTMPSTLLSGQAMDTSQSEASGNPPHAELLEDGESTMAAGNDVLVEEEEEEEEASRPASVGGGETTVQADDGRRVVTSSPHYHEVGEEGGGESPLPPPAIPDTTDESLSLSTTPRLSETSKERADSSNGGSSGSAASSPHAGDTEGSRAVVVEGSGGSSGESGSSRVVVEPNARMLVEKAERLETLLLESSSKVGDLEKALELKEEELRDMQRTYSEEIAKAVGRGDGSLQSLRREMQKLRQRCADLQEEVREHKKGSERDVEAARQEMEGELALLLGQKESSIADLKAKLAAERSRSSQLEKDLTTTCMQLKEKDASSTTELTTLRRQLHDYSQSNTELKNAYANANAEVERMSSAMASGGRRTEELEKAVAAAELRAENASTESAKLAQQVFELQSNLHEKDLAASTSEAIESAKRRVTELEDTLRKREQRIEEVEDELRQTKAWAESDKERFTTRISGLESDLASARTALEQQSSSPPTTDLQETITRLQKGMTQAAQGHMREVEVLQRRISEKDRRIEALVCEVNTYRNDQQQESSSYKSGRSDIELGEMSPSGTPRVGRNKRIRDGMVELRAHGRSPILKVVNEIDTVARGAVRQLVRSPFARVLLLLYTVALHVWVLLILQWSLRESHTAAAPEQ